MKCSGILVGALLSSALLAACGGNHGFAPPTSVLPQIGGPPSVDAASSFKVLYRFKGGSDGAFPSATLTYSNGVLYGSTQFGGRSSNCAVNSPLAPGCGTIFRFNTSDPTYMQIHDYPASGLGGSWITGQLLDIDGSLYGATAWGGSSQPCHGNTGCGSIFRVGALGHDYDELFKFDDANGYAIYSGLVADSNGMLYGTTLAGGTGPCRCGLVFSYDRKDRSEKTIYQFKGGTDGYWPTTVTPIIVNGTLYGTTEFGGGSKHCSLGCGTIYAINLKDGKERFVYALNGGIDGAYPLGVIEVNGALYGLTNFGGDTSCSFGKSPGCGTIFRIGIDLTGHQVLHSFKGGEDGLGPNAPLAVMNHEFYGTTSFGGGTSCISFGASGCGILFEVGSSGGSSYRVVHRFAGGKYGSNPNAGLIEANGTLYGTTYAGGMGCGCGTVFSLKPKP